MTTEPGTLADTGLMRLMRIATHLNVGATIALCLWMAWAAYGFAPPSGRGADTVSPDGCECWVRATDRP